jgi:hypothetical protein
MAADMNSFAEIKDCSASLVRRVSGVELVINDEALKWLEQAY